MMDLRKIFESVSLGLTAKFQQSVQIKHHGGKGDNREDAFVDFLRDYLPNKYGTGRGEVISSNNDVSGELDIVIYDKDHCPLFLKSQSHSLYPIESVFGAISMKSHLDSAELKDAYQNIVSLKKIASKQNFSHSPNPGMQVGLAPVTPVTAIFAYAANRSLSAIAKQVKELDSQLEDISLRPDFVVVLGLGIVGPSGKLRNNFNKYTVPESADEVANERKTGRHTLLRFYMQLLDELNTITQKPLDLHSYFEMPSKVGEFKVRKHDRLMIRKVDEGSESSVKRLTQKFIEKIVAESKPVTLEQHFINHLGSLPIGAENIYDLSSTVYEYNPLKKPSLQVVWDEEGRPTGDKQTFQPYGIEIDGKRYAVDMGDLSESDFEDNPDFTVDELMSR
ncbi:DUF6602 domain-containing protein [Shewanella algae]|uniref:DUF6602 domain-containing protein n=1 Tax=Shewanella algae TaxID=38313 RepID=UPI0037370289